MTIVGNAHGTIKSVRYNFLKRRTRCSAKAKTNPTKTCPANERTVHLIELKNALKKLGSDKTVR